MSGARVRAEDVAREAAVLLGSSASDLVAHVHELRPRGTLRSFRVRDLVVRVDDDPQGALVGVEGLVLDVLATAATPALAPALVARGSMPVGRAEGAGTGPPMTRPCLARAWVPGDVVATHDIAPWVDDVGALFARLHAARVMDLSRRLGQRRPWTLLEAFRSVVDNVRSLFAARERLGFKDDALARVLGDLQGTVRELCIAQDPLFLVARRPVLCHGSPTSRALVRCPEGAPSPFMFVGLERACLGDGAEDLARFAWAARLDAQTEEALLRAYLHALGSEGRADARVEARYRARRTLTLFAEPVAALTAMVQLRQGAAPLPDHAGRAARELAELEELVVGQLACAVEALAASHPSAEDAGDALRETERQASDVRRAVDAVRQMGATLPPR